MAERRWAAPFSIEAMERRLMLTAGPPYPTHNATVGINLDGFADDSTIGAFNDLSTLFRPWGTLLTPYQPDPSIPTTNPSDPWPDNYPLADAAAITYATTYPDGDYAVSYDGSGNVNFTGLGPGTSYEGLTHDGNHWTGVLHLKHDENGGGILELRITGIDVDDPVRNLHIISPDADLARSPTFRPVFLDKLPLWNGTLRFMDWQQTNENPVAHWSDRTQVDRFSYVTGGGVPIERIIELANLVHKDVWVNTPLHADDDFVQQMALMFGGGLDPSLHVYVENSNELWNNQFKQSRDLLFESRDDPDPLIVGPDDFGRMAQLAGKKILHVTEIFRAAFGAARYAAQVRPIFGAHIALKYWAINAMEYIQRATGQPANHTIYGLAVATYVGGQGDINTIDNDTLTPAILFASMNSFIDTTLRTWTHEHKQVADYYGLQLENYEGGQALQSQNLTNEELKVAAQDAPEMGEVYQHLVNMWVEEGGDIFNTFSLANHYSPNGYWGVLDRIDRPTSVKFEAITSMIAPPAAATAVGVSVSGGLTGNRGDTVHALVDIDDATGLRSVDLTLTYDATRLSISAADVEAEAVLAGWGPAIVNANTPGKLIISLFSAGEAASGAGHLLDLAFHVKADAPAGTSPLNIDATATKLNEGQILSTFTDGGILVPIGAAITGAPPTAPEGAPITLGADLVGAGDGVTYLWHVLAANGQAIADSTDAQFTFTPDDNGSYTVTLTVTDDAENAGTDSRTIAVGNVAPVAVLAATPGMSAEGTAIAAAGSGTDAGAADALGYHWAVTKNGVAFASGDTADVAFTPNDDGAYALTFTVSDDDGGSSTISRTIDVTNVAPVVTITGAASPSPEGTAIHLGRMIVDPGTADTFGYLWTVKKDGEAYATGSEATFTFTPDAPGVYTVDLTVTDDDGGVGQDAASVTATHVTFRVTSLTGTDYGFDVAFNRAANFAGLNLYRNDDSPGGAVDVTVTGVAQGRVRGSLIYDAARGVYSFVATGGPLTSDEYTVTLGSTAGATDGWTDLRGEALDGDGDGVAGDAAVRTFTLDWDAGDRIVSAGDFARGPGQAVNLPATASGIPIRINDATGLTDVVLTLDFDPALLDVTGVTGPDGWTTALGQDAAGRVTITASGPALGAGVRGLFQLTAAVPSSAAYGTLGLIRISGLSLNGGQVAGHGDGAVEAVAYFGDASGNRGYAGTDAMLIARVSAELDEAFDAYPRLDPLVVGDVTGNGTLSGLDANYVARISVGLEQAQIPAIPDGAGAPGAAPSDALPDAPSAAPSAAPVTLSLPSDLVARPGATIRVPVNISAFDGVRALDLTILYDTQRLDLSNADVTLGASGDGWTLVQNVNDSLGRLRLTLYRTDAAPGAAGTMLELAFRIPDAAPSGASAISLGGSADEGETALASTPGSLRIDAVPPTVLGAAFDPNGGKHRLTVRFGEDVGASLSIDDVTLFDAVTQTAVDRSLMSISYDAATLTATITFPGYAGGVLANGEYTLTIAGQTVTDAAGNGLDGAAGAGTDFEFGFMQILGDINRDGAVDQADEQILQGAMGGTVINAANGDADGDHRVDFNDLVRLAQNYNHGGHGAAEGDFNGDGLVDFNDLVVLAQNYNRDGRGDLNGDGVIDHADLDLMTGILNPPAAAPSPAVALISEPQVAAVRVAPLAASAAVVAAPVSAPAALVVPVMPSSKTVAHSGAIAVAPKANGVAKPKPVVVKPARRPEAGTKPVAVAPKARAFAVAAPAARFNGTTRIRREVFED